MYILFTAILSIILCFAVVLPLWYFATTSSHLYTVIISTVFLIFIIATLCVKAIRRYKAYTTSIEKKKFTVRLLFSLLILIAVIAAVIFSVAFVLVEKRLIALIIVLAGTAAIIVLKRIRTHFSDV